MISTKKIVATAAAVVLAGSSLLGGTLAWQSINQTALNEAYDDVNPGGRLHDDFNGENKDIYVENFADEDIFARVKLSEYMELLPSSENWEAVGRTKAAGEESYITGGKDMTGMYMTYYFDDTASDFRDYVDWSFGGGTTYMPTFNMNKDSLAADVNGTLQGVDEYYPWDVNDTDEQYSDYADYTEGQSMTRREIRDADTDDDDELKSINSKLTRLIVNEAYDEITLNGGTEDVIEMTADGVEHLAKKTPSARVISMQQWMDEGSPIGDIWVYDTDGWAYYAKPIAPGEASGLLLDKLWFDVDDEYYYSIYVDAQFVTKNDVGSATEKDGFYNDEYGTAPTDNALKLLATIGAMKSEGFALERYTVTGQANVYGVQPVNNTGEVTYELYGNKDAGTNLAVQSDGSVHINVFPGEGDSSILTIKGTDSTGAEDTIQIEVKFNDGAGA